MTKFILVFLCELLFILQNPVSEVSPPRKIRIRTEVCLTPHPIHSPLKYSFIRGPIESYGFLNHFMNVTTPSPKDT